MAKKVAGNSLKKELLEIGVAVAAIIVIAEVANAAYKLEKKGKLNKKEAGKMVQDAVSKYQRAGTKYVKEAQVELDKLAKASPFVTKSYIRRLNLKVDQLSKKAAAKVAKK
jgi:polyhydroxyalkanoate synthesis regulator phasin